jgi:hypothetical protein
MFRVKRSSSRARVLKVMIWSRLEKGPAMPRRKLSLPGSVPAGSAPEADDLAVYETDDLPPIPVDEAPDASQLLKRIRVLENKIAKAAPAKAEAGPVMVSADEAKRTCEAQVKAGVRPRAVLTPEGWYTHREMARVKRGDE